MTLVERLEKFPQMYSHDGAHWYADPVTKEAICLEAAARIRELEAKVAGMEHKVRVRTNVMRALGKLAMTQERNKECYLDEIIRLTAALKESK